MRRFVPILALAALLGASLPAAADTLKVGVSAGPYGEILQRAAVLAADQGLAVEIVEFTEWTTINEALSLGDIDLNNFQHIPYLENQVAQRGYELVPLAPSIVVPMGVYSSRHASLDALPDGAAIGLPNDPTNAARALQLLAAAGLIELAPEAGAQATPIDITANPRRFSFVELDAAQLPRSLPDLDAAAITLNYAALGGLKLDEALLREQEDSAWTLVFVARRDRAEDPTIQQFIEVYRSQAVKDFVVQRFGGTILPTW